MSYKASNVSKNNSMQGQKHLGYYFVYGKFDGDQAQDCPDKKMVPNKVGLRLKSRVNLVHTNESKVGNNHGKSYVEAFAIFMSFLDNKFHDTN